MSLTDFLIRSISTIVAVGLLPMFGVPSEIVTRSPTLKSKEACENRKSARTQPHVLDDDKAMAITEFMYCGL